MSTKDLMLDYLRSEGFRPEKNDYGITFRFEGSTFLYLNNDNDNDFLQLTLPAIFDVDNNNRSQVLVAMNKANAQAKVVKCATMGDSVWVFFEILIDSTPELGDIIPRALAMLKNGQSEFYNAMRG